MKSIILFLAFLIIPSFVFADTKQSAYTIDNSPADSDRATGLQGGTANVTYPLSAIKAYINAGVTIGVNWGNIGGVITAQNWHNLTPYLNHDAINWTDTNIFTQGVSSNIGVGTIGPQNLFEVGNGLFDVSSTGNVGIGTTASQSPLRIVAPDQSSSTVALFVKDSLLNSLFSVKDDGEVGIGTGNTSADLTIAGTSNPLLQLIDSSAYSGNFPSGASIYFRADPSAFGAVTSGSIITNIEMQGESGAGPSHDIEIGARIISKATNTWIDNTSSPANLKFITTPAGSVTPSTRMTVDSTGNIGIGTDQPQSLLDVKGSVRSSSFFAVGTVNGITSTTCSHWTGGLCDAS